MRHKCLIIQIAVAFCTRLFEIYKNRHVVTYDFERLIKEAAKVNCSEFGKGVKMIISFCLAKDFSYNYDFSLCNKTYSNNFAANEKRKAFKIYNYFTYFFGNSDAVNPIWGKGPAAAL